MTSTQAPGPRGLELLAGILGRRARDPLAFYAELVRRHGDVVGFRVGTKRFCLINDPTAIEHVLKGNARNYTKGPGYDRFRPLVGNGLLTSEGEHWRRQRRLSQPPFHQDSVAGFADVVAEIAARRVQSWQAAARAGRPIDMSAEMMRLTLEVVGRTLLGTEVGSEADVVAPAIAEVLRRSDAQLNSALRLLDLTLPVRRHVAFALEQRLPTSANRRLRRAVATLDQLVARVIRERRAARGAAPRDLLQLLLEARDEEAKEGMTDEQLRDEVMTMLLAGHETTATALAWTFYLLDRNPAAAECIRAEIAPLGQRPPRFADLAALPYTRRAFDEVLRLYPPFWRLSRQAIADDQVGSFRVRAGATLLICPYLTHRHPAFWPDPERFDPERFAGASRPRFAYYPFGGGPRICIGNAFAILEAIIVMVTVLAHYRPRLVPGHVVEQERRVTLRPRGGLPMLLEEVHA